MSTESEDEYNFIIEAAARAAHEANRAYCLMIEDPSQLPWDEAPTWQRESCRAGARAIWADDTITPEQSHVGWMRQKAADGWVWGPSKDVEARTHPCMLPYDELPPEQRAKDAIFGTVVRAIFAATLKESSVDYQIRRRPCSVSLRIQRLSDGAALDVSREFLDTVLDFATDGNDGHVQDCCTLKLKDSAVYLLGGGQNGIRFWSLAEILAHARILALTEFDDFLRDVGRSVILAESHRRLGQCFRDLEVARLRERHDIPPQPGEEDIPFPPATPS